ncbi:MAG: ATP-binding cassette domain-containing protein [Gammaproteobacteria bacterium]|nr:ATP-binding cassette domain-containing protein [Gammaproteobacteria bacterium]
MLGIIGPNGAGKSTLLRVMAGLRPRRGTGAAAGARTAVLAGCRARARASATCRRPHRCTGRWTCAPW